MKKTNTKLARSVLIGMVYYIVTLFLNIAFMVYYHLLGKHNNPAYLKSDQIEFYEKLSVAFKIIPIAGIILCGLSFLIMILKKKQHAVGLTLPMLLCTAQYCVLLILNQVSFDSFGGIQLIFIIISIISAVLVSIAYVINNLPLKIAGTVLIALFVIFDLYAVIFKLSSDIKVDSVQYYNNEDFFQFAMWFMFIISFVLVIVQLFLNGVQKTEKTIAYSYNSIGKSANNNNVGSADKLLEYKGLLDIGAITQDEFEQKKKELLDL